MMLLALVELASFELGCVPQEDLSTYSRDWNSRFADAAPEEQVAMLEPNTPRGPSDPAVILHEPDAGADGGVDAGDAGDRITPAGDAGETFAPLGAGSATLDASSTPSVDAALVSVAP